MNVRQALTALATTLLALATTPSARAQCQPSWQPFDPTTASLPGVLGDFRYVNATRLWDPDGPGPQTSRVVVAGSFTAAGSAFANNIAAVDPLTNTWTTLGPGLNSTVWAVATLPNNDLVAGGSFTAAGDTPVNRIARWSVSTGQWSPLGTGITIDPFTLGVQALVAMPNGDIIAGGAFSAAGGVPARNIARWNAATQQWTPMGEGVNSEVRDLLALPNGDVIAGGAFSEAGSVRANCIARWSAASGQWEPLGTGMTGGTFSTGRSPVVDALAVLPNGDLAAGGGFAIAGGVPANNIARWSAELGQWFPMGGGFNSIDSPVVMTLTTLASGDLVAGGSFTPDGSVNAPRMISRWVVAAQQWFTVGTVDSDVRTLTPLPSGDFIAGGAFYFATNFSINAQGIVRWNAATAQLAPLGTAINARVLALAATSNNNVIAGGAFTTAGGVAARAIARWNGSVWSALGTGLTQPTIPAEAYALLSLPNGDMIAGGRFIFAGSAFVNNIARWVASTGQWLSFGSSPSGSGLNGNVFALATLPGGDIIAGGDFTTAGGVPASGIARWNPQTRQWAPLGTGMSGVVHAVVTLPNGDLIAGGSFSLAGVVTPPNIARWSPETQQWSPLGVGVSNPFSLGVPVRALAALPSGEVVAAGSFVTAGGTPASRIARWNPWTEQWFPFGTGITGPNSPSVSALATLPNGDIIAGGDFTIAGELPVNSIALWNGSTWSSLGAGMSFIGAGGTNLPTVSALMTLPNGDIIAAGDFVTAGASVTPSLARYTTTPTCYANCDCSASSSLTPDDFACFLAKYRAGDPYANCDNSTTISPADFTCFLNRYRAGCP